MKASKRFRFPSRLALLLAGLAIITVGGAVYATAVILPHDNIRTANLPPTKLAFLQQVEATEVAVQTAVPTAIKNPNRPHPMPAARPTYTGWIINREGPVPLPSEFFKIENVWVGNVGGTDIQVYAGLEREKINPPQGVLVVDPIAPDSAVQPAVTEYLTPVQAGAVRITSFSGTKLTVSETTGSKQFVFDVATKTWSSP